VQIEPLSPLPKSEKVVFGKKLQAVLEAGNAAFSSEAVTAIN